MLGILWEAAARNAAGSDNICLGEAEVAIFNPRDAER